MTTAPYEVEVRCEGCGVLFRGWRRNSVNLRLDPMSDDDLDDALSVQCPACGHRDWGVGLVVDDGGAAL